MSAKSIIQKLQLIPHPEGGFYKETYISKQSMTTNDGKQRNVSTAIYYLLENEDKSLFHRIKSDELWFFHQGNPIEIIFIHNSLISSIILGNDLKKGELPQAKIPANTWFAAKIKNDTGYSLVSCVVAPGFDFADFQLAKKADLILEYPHLKEIIIKFTL
jgi:predicted cupin superfamily sugar epimerase